MVTMYMYNHVVHVAMVALLFGLSLGRGSCSSALTKLSIVFLFRNADGMCHEGVCACVSALCYADLSILT